MRLKYGDQSRSRSEKAPNTVTRYVNPEVVYYSSSTRCLPRASRDLSKLRVIFLIEKFAARRICPVDG